jgi:hypothetical protein
MVRGSLAAVLAMLLLGCRDAPPQASHAYLPSHPSWEMFPRASSPPASCPGQYRNVIQDSSGDFFLGCWGQRADRSP